MIKAQSSLLFIVLAARIVSAQTCNCNTVGSTTGHGYFYIHGNTNANSSSIFRLTKWQNSNAHLDVMDGRDLHLNYYAGNHIYFGTAAGSAHSIFKKNGQLGINTMSPLSGYILDVNGSSIMRYLRVRANGSTEGGEVRLDGPSGKNAWLIDNYSGDFRFHHSGNEYLRIKDSGNVGIGTKNPDQKLTVNGSVNIGGENNGSLRVRHVTGKNSTNAEYGDLFLNYHTSKPVYIGTAVNKAPLYIHGNIGVGTTATNARVDVKASSSNQHVFRISHPTAPAAAGLIVGFGKEGNGQNDSSIDFKVDFSSTTYNVLGIDRTSRDFYYNGDGNVGIGTTNPTEKLSVNGTIRSKEVLVEASPWPDYV
ncbi:MAG: hypothetical protein AAFY41_11495, partial [Bacteroidota bacterium]